MLALFVVVYRRKVVSEDDLDVYLVLIVRVTFSFRYDFSRYFYRVVESEVRRFLAR